MTFKFKISANWKLTKFDDLVLSERGAIRIGPFGSALKKSELSENGIQVLGIDHITPNKLIWQKPKFIPHKKYLELVQYTVSAGDILITNMGTVGRACFVPEGFPLAIISSHLIKATVDLQKCLPQFLSWTLNYCPFVVNQIKSKSQGAIMAGFNTSLLKSLMIPLPTVTEQEYLVEVFEKADHLLEKHRETVKLSEDLLRSVFLDMFGDPITNSKGWPKTRLGDICQIQLGKMLSEKSKTGINSFPYLRNANVQWRTIHLHDLFEMDFSEAEREKFSLRNGDLLVCEGGEVGKCAIWHGEMRNCYFQKALHRLRPELTKLTPEYLQELFFEIAQRNGFLPHSSQVTIAHLTKEKLTEYPIPTPPIAVQKAFTETYQKILVLRGKEKVALKESENLFNSLLQRAFQGELAF